jgi:hypothetical protein
MLAWEGLVFMCGGRGSLSCVEGGARFHVWRDGLVFMCGGRGIIVRYILF